MLARLGFGRAPHTFGELVQGPYSGAENCMISLPIARYAEATAHQEISLPDLGAIVVTPSDRWKSRLAVERLLRGFDFSSRCPVRIKLTSAAPLGHGYASSSSDMVSACLAVADLLNMECDAILLSKVLASVEPTDPVMYDRPVLYEFFKGELVCDPGKQFPAIIVGIEGEHPTPTLALERLPYSLHHRRVLNGAFDRALEGLIAGDLASVAEAAHMSATVHQQRYPRSEWEYMNKLLRSSGGLGLVVAHSGTLIAHIFRLQDAHLARTFEQTLRRQLPRRYRPVTALSA